MVMRREIVRMEGGKGPEHRVRNRIFARVSNFGRSALAPPLRDHQAGFRRTALLIIPSSYSIPSQGKILQPAYHDSTITIPNTF